MADPDDEKRQQFSITMKPSTREKLEKLARMRDTTVAALLERLAEKELSQIDDQTWAMIDSIQERVREKDAPAKTAAGRKRKQN